MGFYRIDPNAGIKSRVTALALQGEERRLSRDNRGRAYLAARQQIKPKSLDEDNQLRAYFGLDPVQTSGGPAGSKYLARVGNTLRVERRPDYKPAPDSLAPANISMANPTLQLINSEARRGRTIQSERGLANDLGISMPKQVRYDGQDTTYQPGSNLDIGVRRQLIRQQTPYTAQVGTGKGKATVAIRPDNTGGQAPITQAERVLALAGLDQRRNQLKAESRVHKETARKVKSYLKFVVAQNSQIEGPRAPEVVDTEGEIIAHIKKIYPNFDIYGDPGVMKAIKAAVTPQAVDMNIPASIRRPAPNRVDTTAPGYDAMRAKELNFVPKEVYRGKVVYGKQQATRYRAPTTRMVDNSLVQYNYKTGKWDVAIKGTPTVRAKTRSQQFTNDFNFSIHGVVGEGQDERKVLKKLKEKYPDKALWLDENFDATLAALGYQVPASASASDQSFSSEIKRLNPWRSK